MTQKPNSLPAEYHYFNN